MGERACRSGGTARGAARRVAGHTSTSWAHGSAPLETPRGGGQAAPSDSRALHGIGARAPKPYTEAQQSNWANAHVDTRFATPEGQGATTLMCTSHCLRLLQLTLYLRVRPLRAREGFIEVCPPLTQGGKPERAVPERRGAGGHGAIGRLISRRQWPG